MYDAKRREQYAAMHTVADLRDMLQKYYDIKAPSKARKDDLITLIFEARAKRMNEQCNATASAELDRGRAEETSKQLRSEFDSQVADYQNLAQDLSESFAKVGSGLRQFGTKLHEMMEQFTASEVRDLNEAKYRGRFEGKSVKVAVNGTTRRGVVVNRVHRDSDPLNRGGVPGTGLLLLAVKHGDKPRVTLHRAEDVTLVS